MNTTLAQIAVAAQAAANEALAPTAAGAAPDQLAVETVKLAKFAETGFDRGDFPAYEQQFNVQANMLQTWGKQDSPATAAAKKAAAAKEAK